MYGVSGLPSLGQEDNIYEGSISISRPGAVFNDDVFDGDDPGPKYSKVRKPIGAVREVTNGTSLPLDITTPVTTNTDSNEKVARYSWSIDPHGHHVTETDL